MRGGAGQTGRRQVGVGAQGAGVRPACVSLSDPPHSSFVCTLISLQRLIPATQLQLDLPTGNSRAKPRAC